MPPVIDLVARLGKEAIAKGSEAWSTGLPRKAYTELFAPEAVSPISKAADPVISEAKQNISQKLDALTATGDERWATWEAISDNKSKILFMKNMALGTPISGRFGVMAKAYRDMLDHSETLERAAGIPFGHIENYFPQMWKDKNKARVVMEGIKSHIGTTRFYKQRFHETIEQGLAAGLEPVSYNPEVLVFMRMAAAHRNVELLGMLKGLAKTGGAVAHEDWVKLPPSLKVPGHSVIAPDGSQWIIHPDVVPLWKNAIESQSLWEADTMSGQVFRGWMGLKSHVVALRLAVSLFHPVHILSLDNSSRMAGVLENFFKGMKMTPGELGRAAIPRLPTKGFSARVNDLEILKSMNGMLGMDVVKAWKTYDTEWASLAPHEQLAVKLIKEAGGQPTISEELKVGARRAFKAALAQKNLPGMAWHGSRRVLENMQNVIFERWIPSLKVTSFLKEADLNFRRDPSLLTDTVKRRALLREVWKSVDNRYGEMTYNTLHWNRILKDVSVGSMLSLGWNLGFIREMGAGLFVDTPKWLAQVASGKAEGVLGLGSVTRKMWFTYLYTAQTMMLNGVITYALSGKPPSDVRDFIYPWLGDHNTDGSKRRLTTPFFPREFFSIYTHLRNEGPMGLFTFLNSKTMLHPVTELWNNRDYYGYDIHDPNSPVLKQVEQIAAYAWGQIKPITVEQSQQLKEGGKPAREMLLAGAGFPPAPKYASSTAVEGKIYTLYRRRVGEPTRPLAEKERHDLRQHIREAIAAGDRPRATQLAHQAIQAGVPPAGLRTLGIPADLLAFQALSADDQRGLLKDMSYEDLSRYGWYAHRQLIPQFATLSAESQRFWQDARLGKVKPPKRGLGYGADK